MTAMAPKVGDRFIVWATPNGSSIDYIKDNNRTVRLSLEIIEVKSCWCSILLENTICANAAWGKIKNGRNIFDIDWQYDKAEIESAAMLNCSLCRKT